MARKRNWRYPVFVLCLGALGVLEGVLLCPSLDSDLQRSAYPQVLGAIDAIEVEAFVGDIVIPNRLVRMGDRLRLDSKLRFWDGFLLSAPVPDVAATGDGLTLTVPWTRLPGVVVEHVNQIDRAFADQLALWLGIKAQGASTSFRRLDSLTVPRSSTYYAVTEVETIFAVNLFEYLEELGSNYQDNMAAAVSSATKEALEQGSSQRVTRLAVPALAGAHRVLEEELVLTYQESFEAILKGIGRAQGKTPSSVVLVVWSGLRNRPEELAAALEGLEQAALRALPSWATKFRQMASLTLGICVAFGAAFSHYQRAQRRRPTLALLIGVIVLTGAGLENILVEKTTGLLPLTNVPSLELGVLASSGGLVGMLLSRIGVAPIEGTSSSASV